MKPGIFFCQPHRSGTRGNSVFHRWSEPIPQIRPRSSGRYIHIWAFYLLSPVFSTFVISFMDSFSDELLFVSSHRSSVLHAFDIQVDTPIRGSITPWISNQTTTNARIISKSVMFLLLFFWGLFMIRCRYQLILLGNCFKVPQLLISRP